MEILIQVHPFLKKKKNGTDYSFASKSCETCGFVKSPEETWEFLVEIFSSLELGTQNGTSGGEWTHTQIRKKEYVQTNPHEMQLPTVLHGILTQNKIKLNAKTFLSLKSPTLNATENLFPVWAVPFVKKRKCKIFCSTKCPYNSTKNRGKSMFKLIYKQKIISCTASKNPVCWQGSGFKHYQQMAGWVLLCKWTHYY